MKTELRIKAFIAIILITLLCIPGYVKTSLHEAEVEESKNDLLLANNILEEIGVSDNKKDDITNLDSDMNIETDENKTAEEIVYDGLTKQQLVDKINRNLNSTISGKGEMFVDYALELGIDPYLALAIVLHETGCTWDCSYLVKYCNNVGGQQGSPGCDGGAYAAFDSLDEGIAAFMYNLYNNYYAYGLTTPETINPKYASSTTWATSINNYINRIKAS